MSNKYSDPISVLGEALKDARYAGIGFVKVLPDGKVERLDPKDVMIKPRKTEPCGECHLQQGEICDICGFNNK